MVCCRNCKHFESVETEQLFDGICWASGEQDFMEKWMIEEGHCDHYEPVDADNSEE